MQPVRKKFRMEISSAITAIRMDHLPSRRSRFFLPADSSALQFLCYVKRRARIGWIEITVVSAIIRKKPVKAFLRVGVAWNLLPHLFVARKLCTEF